MEYIVDIAAWILINRHDILLTALTILCFIILLIVTKLSKELDETTTECKRLRARLNSETFAPKLRIKRDVTLKSPPPIKFAMDEIDILE